MVASTMLSDEMHDGLFEHRGGQSPAGEVLLATVLDEAPGDVVAEPLLVFLFGVARRQPVPGCRRRACRPVGRGCVGLGDNGLSPAPAAHREVMPSVVQCGVYSRR